MGDIKLFKIKEEVEEIEGTYAARKESTKHN